MVVPVQNPPNPWASAHVEWIDAPPDATLRVYHESARSILSENSSPDLPFRWSINPYRGCFHACAYCYARPSHERLDFGSGTDFERRLVVKTNAVELLRRAFDAPKWRGERVLLSGNTDCYQPLEASYGITRGLLQVCRDYRNPVSIITKGAIIVRDLDVLRELNACTHVHVNVSIPFIDEAMARAIEPAAPSPRVRLKAVEQLAAAGISVGVGVSPMIPGLNTDQTARILEAAHAAGARRAYRTLLRLPGPVETVFWERLTAAFPDRAARVRSLLAQARSGQRAPHSFGERMTGNGPAWQAAVAMFELTCRRLGLTVRENADDGLQVDGLPRVSGPTPFRRPTDQLSLL